MREAVIVSTARTPIGRAYKGAFNNLESPTLAGYPIAEAVKRAGVDPAEVEDCIMGASIQQGTQTFNIGRLAALAGGLPESCAGMSMDRQCSSGLMTIATAAKQIVHDEMTVLVAGGVENITLVQNEHMNFHRIPDPRLLAAHPNTHMSMLETAEIVAKKFGMSREAQDEYALQSQQRTAAAQAAGKFDDEIIPVTTDKLVTDKESGESHTETVDAQQRRGQPRRYHAGGPGQAWRR